MENADRPDEGDGEPPPDARDEFGYTPLITAACAGDRERVESLLARGADPSALSGDGYSALLWAVESESPVAPAILAKLIAAGADLHGVGMNGWTPLHLAAARGLVDKARMLLDAGAEVDRRATIDGEETPLMEAARAGRPETARLLLERGADASLRDVMLNRNAREIAEDAGRGCDPGVFEMLKRQPIQLDPDAILDRAGLEGEARESLRARLESYDAAESYRESADRLAREGRHAEVVRLLDAHAGNIGRLRRWGDIFRRIWKGKIHLDQFHFRWRGR
ncbi:ankyrin repeat domain-containing protein [Planctomyces sp. SH-PL62]|uniref:ankyrin repeat domain-containing protein n=1 Tax=Planctomyces sp. SH-PL62 TaxID=1636152 RepID=UPI00078BA6B6|nr:ankyrin repeat domain-containing protein [Planctomyces sp. SH-PL62]AMV36438.1 Ankyrin repeats (3 copies) [Planctomyces sp. SH-PL62]